MQLTFVAFQPIIRMHKVSICILFYGVAAAEVAVGLAILVSIFRNLGSIDINK
jgi:NADH-quinone oxidoreductase subunit K